MAKQLILYFLLIISAVYIRSDDFLKEKPDFLTPCQLHGTKDTQCLTKTVQNLFSNWRTGVSELSHLGSIDPFKLKRVRLNQHAEGVGDIQLELKKATVTGMANTKVFKAAIDPKDYTFYMQLQVPISKLISDYKLKGRVLLLNLDGRGQLEMDLTDVHFNVIAKTNLVKRGDEYFFDVTSVMTDVKKIGNFKIHLSNLFNGNKELEDSAHELFNNSWRTLFDALRPGITQTWDSIIKDRYKRVFNYIPARFFISDLP